jgi:hypothetical protein
MSAFIRLNKQDAFVVPYTAHKSFSLPYFSDSGSAGVEFYIGTRDRTSLFSSSSLKTQNQYSSLVFDSINHLYYSNFSSSVESGSFENYNQSTLFYSRSLTLTDSTDIFVVDIRRDRFGEAIKPSSFTLITGSITIADDGEGNLQIATDTTLTIPVLTFYSESAQFVSFDGSAQITLDPTTPPAQYTFASASWQGSAIKSPFYLVSSTQIQEIDSRGIIYDATTGVMTTDSSVYEFADPTTDIGPVEILFVSSSNVDYTIGGGTNVGNIFYPHGVGVISKTDQLVSLLKDSVGYGTNVNWQASHTIFQHQYRCRVNESSLNYSQNPSIKSGSNGDTYNFATGSYFQPYITTVGLYNDSNELIAVAKLGQPIPKSRYTDMTFVIALDI